MFEPEVEYPFWQPEPPLPYQPYRGQADPSPSQQQAFISPYATPRATVARTTSARPPKPVLAAPARPTTPRMSKAEALEFVEQCKKWLVAGSIVTFGVLAGLVAGHLVGSASQAANQSNNQAAPGPNSSNTSPSDNGGFFQQPGGSNFGNGNFGQQPVSGSHTS
jgi:hypothetical protein